MEAPKAIEILPYLRSCKKECDEPIKGEVTGEIPKWLKGSLIRVGPGLLEIGPDKFNHIFDGMALMHRFSFQEGDVTYQNRFLRSDTYRKNMKANRTVASEFGTPGVPDPCKTIFQRFSSLFSQELTDNDLVNIVLYGNEAFACSETDGIWKIDTDTLESLQKVNLKSYVPIDTAIAHAHEGTDGTVYNIGTSYKFNSFYSILKFPLKEDEKSCSFDSATVVSRIPASRGFNPSYFHSFAMTENYFILVEQPLYLSLTKMTCAYFIPSAYSEALHFDPNAPARFHVVRRSDGQLLDTSYLSSAFFVFHHINAYEEDGHIIIDLCGYENGDIIKALYVKALEEFFKNPKTFQKPFASNARRYVLPLQVDHEKKNETNLVTLKGCEAKATMDRDGNIFCTYEVLTGAEPWSPELPRIHYEKYNGRKYKYFYATARKDVIEKTCIIKVNTETKETVSWGEKGVIPSEPVFLAGPDSVNEDEDSGVILASLLYQDDNSKVAMIVLNAKTMEEIGRVTFKPNTIIPGDFHGVFVAKN